MYVVTFYSFKGGVGRSMAMMNTAFALVAEGKKVLAVDFDLEAPGLDTFAFPNSVNKNLGVVDFVCSYIKTGIVPEIDEYAFRSSTDDSSGGELWLMPAGRRDEKYADLVNSIDWRELYDKRDGYLLFEDLKAQWRSYLKPDYVLIDSRTGHTDEGGICTRQLPDAVVCLFFPNRQNLIGLTRVVNRIRKENDIRKEKFPSKDPIALHFVTSNIPDLDDENSVLEETLSDFETELQYSELAATIHHYQSLALLNQDIFTLDRPKSRLAGEYNQLVTAIRKNNPEDRKGVLMFLRDELAQQDKTSFKSAREEHIKKIIENHGKDKDILSLIKRFEEEEEEISSSHFSKYLEDEARSYLSFDQFLSSDEVVSLQMKRKVGTASIAIQQKNLGILELSQIIRTLSGNEPEKLDKIDSWPAVKELNEHHLLFLAQLLSFDWDLLSSAEVLIRSAIAKSDKTSELNNDLVLNLIGQNKHAEAIKICKKQLKENASDQNTLFNLAMATWGKTAKVPVEIFQSVLDSGTNKSNYSASYLQRISLAMWATGKSDEAGKILEKAKLKVVNLDFSYWSFRFRAREKFLKDLDEQKAMFSGNLDIMHPPFDVPFYDIPF